MEQPTVENLSVGLKCANSPHAIGCVLTTIEIRQISSAIAFP